MMKFYGHGIVWDKENNTALCTFVDGEYEATDKRTVSLLTELGYEHAEESVKRKTTRKQVE